jgi:hypothetical protein
MPRLPLVLALLVVAWVCASARPALAADPTEPELLPLIQALADASPQAAHPFGPQFPPGLHRNYVKVKIVKINAAETADTQKFLPEVHVGQQIWPVSVDVVVSYDDPSKGETVLNGEFTCYARREGDQWVVGSVRPMFKKSFWQ